MRAVYSPANQAWLITLGDSLVSLHYSGKAIYSDRTELAEDLRSCGLHLCADGRIVSQS